MNVVSMFENVQKQGEVKIGFVTPLDHCADVLFMSKKSIHWHFWEVFSGICVAISGNSEVSLWKTPSICGEYCTKPA